MKTINALLLASVVALTSACAHHGHGDRDHDEHGEKCCGEHHAADAGGDMPMMDDNMKAMHEKMQKMHENMNSMQDMMLTIQQSKPSAARTKMLKEHMTMLEETTKMLHDMPMMKDMKDGMKGEMKDMPMMGGAPDDKHTMPPMGDMKKCDGHSKPKMDCCMGKMMQHMDMMQVLLQQQMMMHQMAAVHRSK